MMKIHDLYITYRALGCSRSRALFYAVQTILRDGGPQCQNPNENG